MSLSFAITSLIIAAGFVEIFVKTISLSSSQNSSLTLKLFFFLFMVSVDLSGRREVSIVPAPTCQLCISSITLFYADSPGSKFCPQVCVSGAKSPWRFSFHSMNFIGFWKKFAAQCYPDGIGLGQMKIICAGKEQRNVSYEIHKNSRDTCRRDFALSAFSALCSPWGNHWFEQLDKSFYLPLSVLYYRLHYL